MNNLSLTDEQANDLANALSLAVHEQIHALKQYHWLHEKSERNQIAAQIDRWRDLLETLPTTRGDQ